MGWGMSCCGIVGVGGGGGVFRGGGGGGGGGGLGGTPNTLLISTKRALMTA